jgi:osmoprotectant transport system substrate-binding protein
VTRETADRYDLRTLADLAPVATSLTLGGPDECPDRPLCAPGLERVYGLTFGEFVPVDAGGPLALEALVRGTVDVALLFTTDGRLDRRRLVLLEDDRGLQPAENITPVIRQDALDRFGPDVERIVDAVSASLTTHALRTMNGAVDAGTSPAGVAGSWLVTKGLLGG